MVKLTARIVILNYNGKELLPLCLPSIVLATQNAKTSTKIAILDNQSKDAGLEWVRQNFPQVEIYESPANRILCSYNDYLAKVPDPIVILLNNDIKVDPHFIDPLVKPFLDDPGVFLVAPKVMTFDGKMVEAGPSLSGIKYGLFWCKARWPGYEQMADTFGPTVSSGFGAFSRELFLELKGYDDRFLPGIFEDVDLSYRAKLKGYKLFYQPLSVVYHIGQASFKKTFGGFGIQVLAARNNFLFMWKNFRGFSFWSQHILFLPLRLLFSLLQGRTDLIQGFFQALRRQCSL